MEDRDLLGFVRTVVDETARLAGVGLHAIVLGDVGGAVVGAQRGMHGLTCTVACEEERRGVTHGGNH
eukprot:scaffold69855_cov69-Phaeocystis_antarctica.AAC.2